MFWLLEFHVPDGAWGEAVMIHVAMCITQSLDGDFVGFDIIIMCP